ncbi:MAG: hypothetical protein LBG83_02565 [Oscillospiraceae bacterium]|jgi:hypothetical protein|nr:hypothetical protein [Oscillospiraceae bacterium]
MRTKKILSVLLAVLTTMTAFGAIGAGALTAEEAAAQVLTINAEPQVAAVAAVGWNNETVQLTDRSDLAGGWDAAAIEWIPFVSHPAYTPSGGTTVTPKDGFYDYYKGATNAATNKASFAWQVWTWDTEKNVWSEYTQIKTSGTATVGTPLRVYYDGNNNNKPITLYISQGTSKYYGKVKVRLTVYVDDAVGDPADATPSRYSEIEVTLVDKTKINKLLAKIDTMITKTDRYTDEFIDFLKEIRSKVGIDLASATDDATRKAITERLQGIVDLVRSDTAIPATIGKGSKSPKRIYKWIGWDVIDDFLGDKFLHGYWKMIDVFGIIGKVVDAISKVFSPLLAIFGAIGKAFGFIIPAFSALAKLFGM